MIFRYRTERMKISFIMLLIAGAATMVLLPAHMQILPIALLLAVYLALMGSVLFTYHEVSHGMLILRHGFGTKVKIPLDNIASVNEFTKKIKKTGVYSPYREKRAYILSSGTEAVEVRLKRPMKIPAILWKEVNSVIFDVRERRLLIEKLKEFVTHEGGSLPPVQSNGSHAYFRN